MQPQNLRTPCPKCDRAGCLLVHKDPSGCDYLHCHFCGFVIFKLEIENQLGIKKPVHESPFLTQTQIIKRFLSLHQNQSVSVQMVAEHTHLKERQAELILNRLAKKRVIQKFGDTYLAHPQHQEAA